MQRECRQCLHAIFTRKRGAFYEVFISLDLRLASLPRETAKEEMMDVMISDVGFIALIVAFFAASAALIRFCANLLGDKGGRS
jgi:hypothetical protein